MHYDTQLLVEMVSHERFAQVGLSPNPPLPFIYSILLSLKKLFFFLFKTFGKDRKQFISLQVTK
jgi:hypothetical protein